MQLRKVAFFGAVCCFACATAQVTQSGSRYTFKARYRKGQVVRYQSVTTIRSVQVGNHLAKISRSLTMKVTRVKGGIATIEVNQGFAFINTTSKGEIADKPKYAEVRLDATNHAQEGSQDAGLFSTIHYLSHPVKIGDSWQGYTTITFTGATAGAGMSTTYRFLGFKVVSGRRMAVLSVSLRGFTSGTGEADIDPRTGLLVRSKLHVTLNTASEGPIPVDEDVRQTR